MLICNHVLAGGVLGVAMKRHPVAGFLVGVGSHLLLDAVPHWGVDKTAADRDERFLQVAKVDGCVGCVLMGTVLALGPRQLGLWTTMAGAVLPDLDKPVWYFFKRRVWPAWFDRLHGRIQRESEDRLRFEVVTASIGAVLVIAGLWVLARSRARRH
jgi:hypothetical protein